MPETSISIHYNGLINGLESAGLLGNGLGTAGVIAAVVSDTDVEVGESYIGVLSSQLGYIGLLNFLVIIYILIWRLIFKYKITNNVLYYNMAAVILGMLLQTFFSESSISIVSTGLYFIFAGICLQKNIRF